jgi:multiple sugar transport system permease protein
VAQALAQKDPSPAIRRKRTAPRLSLPAHWIMLAPALLILCGFMIYPAINAVYLSLTSTNLLILKDQTFIGLDNFATMIADPVFYTALVNSLWWTVGAVSFQLLFGMIGALALNQRVRLRGLIRGLVLLPWATPSVLIALMWMWIFDPNLGIANRILEFIGIGAMPWLADTGTALPTLIFIDIWFGIPFFAVMILAALQSVPLELIEAARIDGANAWQSFWRVVLPLILPAVMITTTLRLIWTANFFDLILILTNGGPASVSLTIPLYAYQIAYRGMDFGLGAALSVAQAGILAILVALYMRQIRKNEIA